MKPSDVIVSLSARSGQVEYKKVLGVSRSISPRLLAVSIADKKTGKAVETIRATPEHPFFTTHGLVSAESLGIGTELVTRAGPQAGSSQALVVKAVTPVPTTIGKGGKRAGFVVYNLEVEDDHTYFVGQADGGAWVHNSCYRDTFFAANLELNPREWWVHHAIPRKVFRNYPGLFPAALEHDLSNLRGIRGTVNTDIHLTDIGNLWQKFFAANPNPTAAQILWMRDFVDSLFESHFVW